VHVSQAEQARAVLEQACGLCHIGGSSQAPAALGIFDLTEPDWTAKMTDEALEGFVARLEDQGIAQDEADIVIGHVSRVLSDRRAEQLAAPDC
jgi:cytochrome c5